MAHAESCGGFILQFELEGGAYTLHMINIVSSKQEYTSFILSYIIDRQCCCLNIIASSKRLVRLKACLLKLLESDWMTRGGLIQSMSSSGGIMEGDGDRRWGLLHGGECGILT